MLMSLMIWMKILDFFFFKRLLFDKQQCTSHQKVDSVLLIFFATNQNWVMKATRGPRANELDEFDEDTNFFKRFLFDKQQCTGHQEVDSVLLFFFFFLPLTKIGS